MYSSHQAELQVAQARNDELARQNKLAQADFERKTAAIQKDMEQRLAAAKSDEERLKIRAEAAALVERANEAKRHRAAPGRPERAEATPAAPARPRLGKKDVKDDPLEGL
jgi:hypothetical protein